MPTVLFLSIQLMKRKTVLLLPVFRFLLLACDGLWKGFTVDAAIKFINNILEVRFMPFNKLFTICARVFY